MSSIAPDWYCFFFVVVRPPLRCPFFSHEAALSQYASISRNTCGRCHLRRMALIRRRQVYSQVAGGIILAEVKCLLYRNVSRWFAPTDLASFLVLGVKRFHGNSS